MWELGSRKRPDRICKAGRVMGGGGVPVTMCRPCTGDSTLHFATYEYICWIPIGNINNKPVLQSERLQYLHV